MKRRKFLKSVSSTIPVAFFPNIIFGATKNKNMDRIGLTTVVFRNRFRSTVPKQMELKNELTLIDIPEYFADRFGIHNVELWTKHFESKSRSYLADIQKNVGKSKSKIIDLQADTSQDLSDPDENKRQKAVSEMKEWVDAGAFLDTAFIRISPMKKSYQQAAKSIREVTIYAKTKGIEALVENHNDMFSNVDYHLRINRDIELSNFGLLADFGNYPKDVDKYKALQSIAPFTKLISAKTKDFNSEMEHTSYDFGKCIKIFENSGYRGIYSLEQWSRPNPDYDYEKITDWMIAEVKSTIG
jgi:sugar phosphate isomerase/epimerase